MKPDIKIRRAKACDLVALNKLLMQVLTIHHEGRPDIFKKGTKKYTDSELLEIISDDLRPIFVADDGKEVLGYAFCVISQHIGDNILTDIKTLYIDDLCVDEAARGRGVGRKLYEYVIDYAKSNGFYNVTLNVWACNKEAIGFYEKLELSPQKIGMEKVL